MARRKDRVADLCRKLARSALEVDRRLKETEKAIRDLEAALRRIK